MAYQIQYSPEAFKRYPQAERTQKNYVVKWFCLVFLFVTILWLRINGIPDFLIPGDPVVTKSAMSAFLDKIQSGSSVNDALNVFCHEILYGAGF